MNNRSLAIEPIENCQALIPAIEQAGGRVLVKANVQHIVVSEKTGRACGVIMSDGTRIHVKAQGIVCSSIGCKGTGHPAQY